MTQIDWSDFEAVLFDLDGVITPTAAVHAAAWQEAFDHALRVISGPDFLPFSEADYRSHVDGRPRYEGVAAFLASRGVELPWGKDDDPAGTDTVCAIGNLKNDLVGVILDRDGVTPYPGSVALLDYLAGIGVKTAIVSSSANAARVLAAAGLADRFEVLVDGVVASELRLRGKPSPQPFLEAARRLGVAPSRAVVVEDAISGVEAGVAGNFARVIGVDREGDGETLRGAGADLVVADLGELVP